MEAETEKKEAYAIIAANAQIFCLWEKIVAEYQKEDRKVLTEKGCNTSIGLIDRLCFDPHTQTVFIDSRKRLAPSGRLYVLDKLDHGRDATHCFIRRSVWEKIAYALLGVQDECQV